MKKCLLFLMAIILLAKTHAQADTTLAVSYTTLAFFQLQAIDKVVLLKWSLEQSDDFKSFDVERADNNNRFMKVGSKLAITKSSSADYDFVDATPKRNVPLRYRLKLISQDGTVSYSEAKEISVVENAMTVRLKQNPVRNTVEVEVNAMAARQASVAIISQGGQQVGSQTFRLSAGLNKLSVSAQSLLQGFYQLVVDTGYERKTISFIKE